MKTPLHTLIEMVKVMSEFVIQTPSENTNCTQSITVSIDDEHITLSDTEYGCQYVTIPLDKWQELKDSVDAKLHGKYHHLRELIKNTDPIKLD